MCPVSCIDSVVQVDVNFPEGLLQDKSTEFVLQDMQMCNLDIQQQAWYHARPLLIEAINSSLLALQHHEPPIDVKWLSDLIVEYCCPSSFRICAVPILKPQYTESKTNLSNGQDIQPQPTHVVSIRKQSGMSLSGIKESLQSSDSSVSWYSSLSCSLSHFGGLPYLRPGEPFPTCHYYTAPLRLAFQILLCDMPVEIRDVYMPESVLSDHQRQETVSPTRDLNHLEQNDSLLQSFYCHSESCLHRNAKGDMLESYDSCSVTPSDRDAPNYWLNPTRRVRWIKAPISAAAPSKSISIDPDIVENGHECQLLAGWQLRTDIVSVEEAATNYKVVMSRKDCNLLSETFVDDETNRLQVYDKFGGFSTDGCDIPTCPECNRHMQVLCSFKYLCYAMSQKSYVYQINICPVHKHLFRQTWS